jgi:hypothetical protein
MAGEQQAKPVGSHAILALQQRQLIWGKLSNRE